MNRENITKVRDVIAALPAERFDMSDWLNDYPNETFGRALKDCGTAACIGGWAVGVLKPRTRASSWEIPSIARRILGLSLDQADKLFQPVPCDDRHLLTPAQAVRVLDILLETGEVDWERAIREVPVP